MRSPSSARALRSAARSRAVMDSSVRIMAHLPHCALRGDLVGHPFIYLGPNKPRCAPDADGVRKVMVDVAFLALPLGAEPAENGVGRQIELRRNGRIRPQVGCFGNLGRRGVWYGLRHGMGLLLAPVPYVRLRCEWRADP